MITFHTKIVVRMPAWPLNRDLGMDEMEEAIFLASPVVFNEWKKSKVSNRHNGEGKLDISLYKYNARAKHRSTPFGLFAGLFLAEWNEENNILIPQKREDIFLKRTRLDMNITCAIGKFIEKHPAIAPYLSYFPNSSLYKISENWRYVESKTENNKKSYKLSQVEYNEFLGLLLEKCRQGLTFEELKELLLNEKIDEEEITAFLQELMESNILVSSLEPNVTGTEYFDVLITECETIFKKNSDNRTIHDLVCTLKKIKTAVTKLDHGQDNLQENRYETLIEMIREILPGIDATSLFQTDLYIKPVTATISRKIQDSILSAYHFINKITPHKENQAIKDFRKRFLERYEDNEIPFTMALDGETGIGYPNADDRGVNPLVDDLNEKKAEEGKKLEWNLLQGKLHKLIVNAIKANKKTIELTEKDFEHIDYSTTNVPDTMAVMYKVLDRQTNRVEFIVAGGCSAINLIGRFGNGTPEVARLIEELAQFEEQKQSNRILAEIVHLPEARTGNILARPTIRKHEIPYMAKSSVTGDNAIPLEDLVISVLNDKIILRSKKLNKEIIPRLSNAHNYSYKSLPVYHFLCDLQSQYYDKTSFAFDWGVLGKEFTFLPRVVYQDIVLKRAQWNFKLEDYEHIIICNNQPEKEKQLEQFVQKHQLPKQFLFTEGDNELLIDIEHKISILTFFELLKKNKEIFIKEYLDETQGALIHNGNNLLYSNECAGILLNTKIQDQSLIHNSSYSSQQDKDAFSAIGDTWVYYKIYCGVKTGDKIVSEKLMEIVDELRALNLVDKWFFVRYADPEFHLRIRFKLKDEKLVGKLVEIIKSRFYSLVHERIIHKIQLDTYKKELNRYGRKTMTTAENLFCNDSDFIIQALSLLENNDEGHEWRWKTALAATDRLASDFGLTEKTKHALFQQLSTAFINELFPDKKIKVHLDSKYRQYTAQIKDILKNRNSEFQPVEVLLQQRSKMNAHDTNRIIQLKDTGALEVEFRDLISSFLHMSLNRIFMSQNRLNECVVYYLLSKYYKSSIEIKELHEIKTGK